MKTQYLGVRVGHGEGVHIALGPLTEESRTLCGRPVNQDVEAGAWCLRCLTCSDVIWGWAEWGSISYEEAKGITDKVFGPEV